MENTDKVRNKEITSSYLDFIKTHIEEVASGQSQEFMQLNQIARELAISHQHLTAVIKKETGHHPCYFYDEEIINKSKELLIHSQASIAKIAAILTYDPSNFSKFFKKWTGETPGSFRNTQQQNPQSSP